MARTFAAASSRYFTNTSTAVLTAVPFTFSVWYFPTSTAADQELISITDNTLNEAFRLSCNWTVPGGGNQTLQVVTRHGNAETDAAQNGNDVKPTANIWNHVLGTVNASRLQQIWWQGLKSPNSATGTAGTTGLARTNLAAYIGGGTFNPVTGLLCDAAIWNVALSPNEIFALSKGFVRPYLVRPQSLVGYWPLTNNSTIEPDYGWRGTMMSPQNSPAWSSSAPFPISPYMADYYYDSLNPPMLVDSWKKLNSAASVVFTGFSSFQTMVTQEVIMVGT